MICITLHRHTFHESLTHTGMSICLFIRRCDFTIMLILFTTLVTRLTRIAQSNSSQDVVSEVMVFFLFKKTPQKYRQSD